MIEFIALLVLSTVLFAGLERTVNKKYRDLEKLVEAKCSSHRDSENENKARAIEARDLAARATETSDAIKYRELALQYDELALTYQGKYQSCLESVYNHGPYGESYHWPYRVNVFWM